LGKKRRGTRKKGRPLAGREGPFFQKGEEKEASGEWGEKKKVGLAYGSDVATEKTPGGKEQVSDLFLGRLPQGKEKKRGGPVSW